jgi:hypothetical protein
MDLYGYNRQQAEVITIKPFATQETAKTEPETRELTLGGDQVYDRSSDTAAVTSKAKYDMAYSFVKFLDLE